MPIMTNTAKLAAITAQMPDTVPNRDMAQRQMATAQLMTRTLLRNQVTRPNLPQHQTTHLKSNRNIKKHLRKKARAAAIQRPLRLMAQATPNRLSGREKWSGLPWDRPSESH